MGRGPLFGFDNDASAGIHDGCGVLKLQRRQFLHLAAGAVRLLGRRRCSGALARWNYPARLVRWTVPMAPGDMPDVLARLLCLVSRFEGNHAGCTLRELW